MEPPSQLWGVQFLGCGGACLAILGMAPAPDSSKKLTGTFANAVGYLRVTLQDPKDMGREWISFPPGASHPHME